MKKSTLVILGLIACLTGCANFVSPVAVPTTQKYVIDYDNQHSGCVNYKHNSLTINPVYANAPYNTTSMFYSTSNYSVNQYAYSVWATLPSNYLQSAISIALENSCAFSPIYSNQFHGNANYQINSNIVKLQQIVNGDKATVELVINVELINNKNANVVMRQFRYTTAVTPSPENFAQATSSNVNNFTHDLVIWVAQQL